jgi:hypothetical protein
MAQKITKWQRFMMNNWIIQFFRFLYLNIKIMVIVAKGHGGTRN